MGQLLSWARASTRDSQCAWEYRWEAGICTGLAEEADQIQEPTPRGAPRVHSVKRLSLAQRRDPELVTVIMGLPRESIPGGAPRSQRVSASFAPEVPEEEAPARTQSRREEAAPREYYIRQRAQLVLHGYRERCPGCAAATGDTVPRAYRDAPGLY